MQLQAVKIVKLAILCLYAIYISVTMTLWDFCWFRSRLPDSPPLNWFLIVLGVASQAAHLFLLFLIWQWLATGRTPKTMDMVLIRNSEASIGRLKYVFLIFLMTVLSSRLVGWGATQGPAPGASFISDRCWDWAIVWHCCST